MGSYDEFDATHRVVAATDEAVPACKRALVARLSERAVELRVRVHPTERADVPEPVTDLQNVDPEAAEFGGDEAEFRVAFPEAEEVVEAVLAGTSDGGSLPVSTLYFAGDGLDAVVTSSTSNLHVGKLRCDDEGLLDRLPDHLAGIGVVVPAGPVIGWEADGSYFELDGPHLCVYAERPASIEDRATTTHACHDLTRLTAMEADARECRIELAWRGPESLVVRAIQVVFGRPPTELVVPPAEFDAVEAYLGRFLPESPSSVSN